MAKILIPGFTPYIASHFLNIGCAALITEIDCNGEWVRACLEIWQNGVPHHTPIRKYKANSTRNGETFRMRGIRYSTADFTVRHGNPADNRTIDDITRGMADCFFTCAWAEQCDESENAPNMSGKDYAKERPGVFDPAAWHAADTLTKDLCRANGVRDLSDLYRHGKAIAEGGDRPLSAELFGWYLAMTAMGQGVGISDAFGIESTDAGIIRHGAEMAHIQTDPESVRVPYLEFGSHSLQRDYF